MSPKTYVPEEEASEGRKYLHGKEDVVEEQKRQQQHSHARLHEHAIYGNRGNWQLCGGGPPTIVEMQSVYKKLTRYRS